ncbi:retrovirus-related pol polyprotein from transposon TNT 1-94 [Tanacetum coccineum]
MSVSDSYSQGSFKVRKMISMKKAWEGVGVVASAHKLIGATNPLQAECNTIREDLAVQTIRHINASDDISTDNGNRCNIVINCSAATSVTIDTPAPGTPMPSDVNRQTAGSSSQLKMSTLAEFMIVAGAENRPPMFDKTMYNSWESRMLLYIKGKKNGRMMLVSIENGPLVYPTVEEDAKDNWERVKLLMKSTELSYQEHECKLYNEFDKFTSVKGETLHEYYLRFAQLINDMDTIGMTMQQVQVNTKFLNALQPEWSKFVTNVKLAKNMYTTNYDQLYAYLSQHVGHTNEVLMMRERYSDPLQLVANYQTQSNSAQYS